MIAQQYHLFAPALREPPLVVAYGMGVDSTAMLIGMEKRGIRPDIILFADVGGEKPDTYLYAPIFREWLPFLYDPDRVDVQTIEGNVVGTFIYPASGTHSVMARRWLESFFKIMIESC